MDFKQDACEEYYIYPPPFLREYRIAKFWNKLVKSSTARNFFNNKYYYLARLAGLQIQIFFGSSLFSLALCSQPWMRIKGGEADPDTNGRNAYTRLWLLILAQNILGHSACRTPSSGEVFLNTLHTMMMNPITSSIL